MLPLILLPILHGLHRLSPDFISAQLGAVGRPGANAHRERSLSTVRRPVAEVAEPQVEVDHEVSRNVWKAAGLAAASALQDGANATTILMPSGAGDVQVGLELVKSFIDTTNLPYFRIVLALPESLAAFAGDLYAETFSEDSVKVITMGSRVSKFQVSNALMQNSSTIFLCPYSMMLKFGLAYIQSKIKTPLDLMVYATAHILRAGGFYGLGARDDILPATRRVFISPRHMFGLAPGALLAPGQEAGFPEEAPQSKFGPEVYRLTHEDAEQRQMTVPLRLQIIDSTGVAEVAKELADLHLKLGIKSIHVAPEQTKLTSALSTLLSELTDGRCTVTTGADTSAGAIDALLVSGQRPNYVKLAQEFPRLARWQPEKSHGFIIAAGAAKDHAVAAWMAFAVEDQRAEEALQRTSVEFGRIDRRLKWNELPYELRSLVYRGSARKHAEIAIARGVEALGDPWDFWLGRLLAYQERHKNANARFLATQFGHELGAWLKSQRQQWESGTLKARKVARLKGLGVMLDQDAEMFAKGLSELRMYVSQQRKRVVPWNYVSDSSFRLGEWVVEQRTLQRRGKLTMQRQQLLKEAFFLWQPAEAPSSMFEHPEDPEAADVTHAIEDELRSLRWQTITQRRAIFRAMVLRHHPDISESQYANDAIRFLSEVRDWFLAGN